MAGEVAETAPSLPYHEPAIGTILVQASFLLLLNLVNAILDRLVYCGLLGQVLVGIAWGTPGAKWLSVKVEEVVVQLGYIGLILLVYEGGLSTSFKSLKANLLLSSAVAITGIAIPVALSYSLQGLLNATPLQAFAAGAALCSTSLGTTFTVLASSGLSSSRLGVVLTSAAMMDDVVGLVMVQVIANLGGGSINPLTVVRPILVSIAFAIVVPLVCHFVIKPMTISLNRYRETHPGSRATSTLQLGQAAFMLHTALLMALVAGASYAGTSNLFAAYIAGATISWWDSEVPHLVKQSNSKLVSPIEGMTCTALPRQGEDSRPEQSAVSPVQDDIQAERKSEENCPREKQCTGPQSHNGGLQDEDETSGSATYEQYYQQAVRRILQPFFFASIGFSIPIGRMFQGPIVWRGIVYTILMIFAKMVCGLWLVRFSLAPANPLRTLASKVKLPSTPHLWGKTSNARTETQSSRPQERRDGQHETAQPNGTSNPHTSTAAKPFSIHPPLILACAMTARGEIGFLISAVAESNGVFSSSGGARDTESDIFLVVTWAIVLCTVLGPLGVGFAVRRVKQLEKRKNTEQDGAGRDVLGVWGVE